MSTPQKEFIKCHYHNEVFLKLEASDDLLYDQVSDTFTFIMPNYEVMKRVNKKFFYWDGRIKLFKKRQKLLPYGLIRKLKTFCESNNYDIIFDDRIKKNINFHITEEEIKKYLDTLDFKFELRDYQVESIVKSIRNKRLTDIMPTGSGKSGSMYAIARWIQDNDLKENEKILIVVPNKGLLVQMKDNFAEYGYTGKLHCIQAGVEKDSNTANIYCSTWQSIFREPKEYFDKFKVLIWDEIQILSAKVGEQAVKTICENCTNASYRFGFTGTLHDENIHKTVVEAYFGTLFQPISTHTLIERGQVSKFNIKNIILNYPPEIVNELSVLDFQQQKEFQESPDNPRQQLIISIAESLENNTLILFNTIDHGQYIFDQLINNNKRKTVYYIDGSVSGEERNNILAQMENENGSLLVASFGTLSAGANLKNLHNIIFASSTKSKIRTLQSIGRGLRLHSEKEMATLYDITDNFGYMETHGDVRESYYNREKFDSKEYKIYITDWIKNKNMDWLK